MREIVTKNTQQDVDITYALLINHKMQLISVQFSLKMLFLSLCCVEFSSSLLEIALTLRSRKKWGTLINFSCFSDPPELVRTPAIRIQGVKNGLEVLSLRKEISSFT